MGKVDISNNVKISQFYQVRLSHDVLSIHFNSQSVLAGLYIIINVFNPSINNSPISLLQNSIDSF